MLVAICVTLHVLLPFVDFKQYHVESWKLGSLLQKETKAFLPHSRRENLLSIFTSQCRNDGINTFGYRQISSLRLYSHSNREFKSDTTLQSSNDNALSTFTLLRQLVPLPNITVILPAYNEELRIRDTILKYSTYLSECTLGEGNPAVIISRNSNVDNNRNVEMLFHNCQMLVVDDGSTDNTVLVVRDLMNSVNQNGKMKLEYTSIPKNSGKCSALVHGCNNLPNPHSINVILMADADGSGDIASLQGMMKLMRKHLLMYSIVMARTWSSSFPSWSSPHPLWFFFLLFSLDHFWDTSILVNGKRVTPPSQSSQVASATDAVASIDISATKQGYIRLMRRSILRWGYRTCISFLTNFGTLVGNVSDTQCGFKCMTTRAARNLYAPSSTILSSAPTNSSTTERPALFLQRKWSHDVEILFRAQTIYEMPIVEADVYWTEKLEGSKLIKSTSSAMDVVRISVGMLVDVILMRLAYASGHWK